MEITVQMIKELREATHAGMLDCKKALEAAGGDVEKATAILREKGLLIAAKKADREAKEGLIEIVDKLDFQNPAIPIIANVTAQPLTTGEQVKTELIDQLCNGVQWQRSIEYMRDNGVSACIEIGQGKVLTGLIKRIDRNITTNNIGIATDIDKLLPKSPDTE